MSECLQYPDFSVVVLYKKVIIAFGFMVPDVKYNEAYISFLFVHPEWRRAGIATFMIYHLIQVIKKKKKNPMSLLKHQFSLLPGMYMCTCSRVGSAVFPLSPCPLFAHTAAQIVSM